MEIAGSWQIDNPCPACDGPVIALSSCPGYDIDGRVMVCQGCGNATDYRCVNGLVPSRPGACPWWYRDPPGVRADVATMGEAPAWLGDYQIDPEDEENIL